MAVKVQVQCHFVGIISYESFHHADQLSAFFIDCGRIKIIDFDEAFGSDRVGEWAVVFPKLAPTECFYICDPAYIGSAYVGAELLVSENG